MRENNMKNYERIVALVILIAIVLGGKWLQQDILSEVSKRFDEQNEQIALLTTQSSQLSSSLLALDEQTAKQRDQIKQLDNQSKQRNTALLSDKKAASTKVKTQNDLLDQLSKQLSQLNVALLSLKDETAESFNKNQERMEQLDHQSSQLNDTLVSLTDDTDASIKHQNGQLDILAQQSAQVKTDLKAEMATLAQAQQFEDLTAQVEILTDETAASIKQQNGQLEILAQQSAQVKTDLKAEMATLVQTQQFEDLTAQVQTLTDETAASIKQQNGRLEILAQHSAIFETDLKAEMITLVQTQQLEDLTEQVQTLTDKTAASIKQQNGQLEILAQQLVQAKTDLKAEMATLVQPFEALTAQVKTDLKAEMATLAQAQPLENLTAQVQTLTDETAASVKQQNGQLEILAQQLVQAKTDLKAEMATLAQAQPLENLTAQVQTLAQQSVQVNTDLKAEIATLAQLLEDLTAQVQTLNNETAVSVKQQNEQSKINTKAINSKNELER